MSQVSIVSSSFSLADSYLMDYIPNEKHPLEIKKVRVTVQARYQKDVTTNLVSLQIYSVNTGNFKLETRCKMLNLIIDEMQQKFPNFTITCSPFIESARLGLTYQEYAIRFPAKLPAIQSLRAPEQP